MTDLTRNETVADSKGRHFHFVSLETDQASADKLIEELSDAGFQAGSTETALHQFEVFTQFSLAEEIIFRIEEKFCKVCSVRSAHNSCDKCPHKKRIDDAKWKESLKMHRLLQHDLAKLREEFHEQ